MLCDATALICISIWGFIDGVCKRKLKTPAHLMRWTTPERHRCAKLLAVKGWSRKEPSTDVTAIGLDIAKNVFQVHGANAAGVPLLRRKLRRADVLKFFKDLPRSPVGIEACGTAHHWAREITAFGHDVKLLPPNYVKAYVKRGKTDAADAEAICEAVSRTGMRFVPVKTLAQQSVLMLHRTRDLLVRQRTMLINAIRGHMAELGYVMARGRDGIGELMAVILGEEAARLPEIARETHWNHLPSTSANARWRTSP
jgi:transposase